MDLVRGEESQGGVRHENFKLLRHLCRFPKILGKLRENSEKF
jgi:hypothetical protein